jgi:hypothetical protein
MYGQGGYVWSLLPDLFLARRRRRQRSDSSPDTTQAAAMTAHVGQPLGSLMTLPKSQSAPVARPHQTA